MQCNACMWMSGWMNGWMDGWMHAWMDGCMHACMDGWMHACMDGWMHACMHRWMDAWMDAYMHGWMDGYMYSKIHCRVSQKVVDQERRSLMAAAWSHYCKIIPWFLPVGTVRPPACTYVADGTAAPVWVVPNACSSNGRHATQCSRFRHPNVGTTKIDSATCMKMTAPGPVRNSSKFSKTLQNFQLIFDVVPFLVWRNSLETPTALPGQVSLLPPAADALLGWSVAFATESPAVWRLEFLPDVGVPIADVFRMFQLFSNYCR